MTAHVPSVGSKLLPALLLLIGPAAAGSRAQEGTEGAVAAIQKLGGKVERDEKAPDKPVTAVNLGITEVKDDGLEHLKGLTKLKRLTLNDTPITNAGLDHIKDLAGLERLYLVDTKITDAGLERLKGLSNLRVLSLAGTQVTDAGMEHLKGLSNLRELFLYGTKVGDEGVAEIKESLPDVTIYR